MGFIKFKRPIDVRPPGPPLSTNQADNLRANLLRWDLSHLSTGGVQIAATSGTLAAAITVGPRGTFLLSADSSAGGKAPTLYYLAPMLTVGDRVEIGVAALAASCNGISLRTSSSGVLIRDIAGTADSLLFTYPGQSAVLLATATSQWVMLSGVSTGAVTSTGASGAFQTLIPPILGVSTS